jgi:hypothetical protein
MFREPEPDPVLMELETPREVELEIVDMDELEAKVIERFVEAVDRAGHKLSIVQVEEIS